MKHILGRFPMTFLRRFLTATVLGAMACTLTIAQAEPGENLGDIVRKLPRNLAVIAPVYPPAAIEQGLGGEVVLEFGLTDDGHARDVSIVRSEPPGIFADAVLAVLPQWLFLPELNDNSNCHLANIRSRQHLYFEVKDGKSLFSFDPLVDIPRPTKPLSQNDAAPDVTAPATCSTCFDKREGLRLKNPLGVVVPRNVKAADIPAFIVARIETSPDGAFETIEFPFVIAKTAAKREYLAEIRRKAKEARLETISGKPPGRRIVICYPFTFANSE